MAVGARGKWAATITFAVLASLAGPIHGVASALVGPVRLPVSQTTTAPAESADSETAPDGSDDAAVAAAEEEGCGGGGAPTDAATCVTDLSDCAQAGTDPAVCATTAVTGAAQDVSGDADCDPASPESCVPSGGEPAPCQDETEPAEQVACVVQTVRDEVCVDETAPQCTVAELVLLCVADAESCPVGDVVAPVAEAVCAQVAPQDEQNDCEERLAACATADAAACESALDYLQERVESTACEPETPACAPVTAVGDLLDCRGDAPQGAPACGFRAVWDAATPTVCGLIGTQPEEGEPSCAEILDACDDPVADEGGHCSAAATYIQEGLAAAPCAANDAICAVEELAEECPGGAQPCAEATWTVATAALCATGAVEDCPPPPVPALHDCLDWAVDGLVSDVLCAQALVTEAVCAAAGEECVLEHPAVQALLAAVGPCAAGAAATECHESLQDVAVAALCANPATCIEDLGDCEVDDTVCQQLAVFDHACAEGSSCPAQIQALRPCVEDAEACDQAFLRGWIGDVCAGTAVASTACPEEAVVRPPQSVSTTEGQSVSAPVLFTNGSSTFPYPTVQEAVAAIEKAIEEGELQTPALDGRVDINTGTYGRVTIPDGLSLTFGSTGAAVIDGGSQAGLVLTENHLLTITEPVLVKGLPRAIQGPQSDVELRVATDWAYVGDWNEVTARYENEVVKAPEPVDVVVAITGPSSGAVTVEILEGGAWKSKTLVDGGAILTTDARGLFDGSVTFRVRSQEPSELTVAVRVVGTYTKAVYAEDSSQLDFKTPQAPPVPPPGVPRTPDHDLPPAVRLSGEDRSATAAAVSRASFPDGADEVFVATGQSYADALAAGPAATRAGSPVVLVERDSIPAATRAELERLRPSALRLMGGSAAISAEVERQLAELAEEVSRLRGSDRYATAAAVSAAHFPAGVSVAYVASGEGFADALSGGAAAATLGGPVLLVQPDALPSSTAEELRRLRPARLVVLGGPGAVSEDVATRLRDYAGQVKRVSGATRYATSAAVSRDVFSTTGGTVYVATGTTFPDALAGVPAAGADRAPLMLVEPDRLPGEVAAELTRLRPKRIVILGGERSVTQRLERELRSYQVP